MPYPAKLSPDAILEAALALFEAGGPEGLSMRTLADKLGVRPSSLYGHYADREALERAMADVGARRLSAAIEQAGAGLDPAAAFKAAAYAYLAFARAHPALYGLLLAPQPPQVAQPGASKDLWNRVLQLVGAVTGIQDDTAGAVALFAYLHGYVVLERSGLFGLSGPRGGFERGLDALLEGL